MRFTAKTPLLAGFPEAAYLNTLHAEIPPNLLNQLVPCFQMS